MGRGLFAGLGGDGFVVVFDGGAVFGGGVLAGGFGEAFGGAGGEVAPVAGHHDDLAGEFAFFDDGLEVSAFAGLLGVLRGGAVFLGGVLLVGLGAGDLALVAALGHGLLLALLGIGQALLGGLLVLLLLLLTLLALFGLAFLAGLLLAGAAGLGVEGLVELVEGLGEGGGLDFVP